jgi:glutathione S-transferase
MSETVTLHGYQFSVYTRIAKMVLHEKGVSYDTVEVDPFSDVDPAYLDLHPFGRVPVLTHDGFSVFETVAITRYIDSAFEGPSLQPNGLKAATRMNQVIAMVDSYGYWPMVRQIFSHRVFQPLAGEPADESEIAAGLRASQKVLAALNDIAEEGYVLNGNKITLADCHLAPMVDYFVRAQEGRDMMRLYPALSGWWAHMSGSAMVKSTEPNFALLGS